MTRTQKKSAVNIRTNEAILSFMQRKGAVKVSQIAEAIHLQPSRTRDYLAELIGKAPSSPRARTATEFIV